MFCVDPNVTNGTGLLDVDPITLDALPFVGGVPKLKYVDAITGTRSMLESVGYKNLQFDGLVLIPAILESSTNRIDADEITHVATRVLAL